MPESLGGRLLVGASVLIFLALLVTGIVMDFELRRFIQGQVDGRLDGQILSVTEALRTNADGSLRLEHVVDGPPFERPLSGWYWEVLAPDPVLRSQSLGNQTFRLRQTQFDVRPKPVTIDGTGPPDEPLHVRIQRVGIGNRTIAIASAAPLKALEGPLRDALTPLVVTMILLGLTLTAGVLLQIRVGLRPLETLQAELTQVRAGRAQRIAGPQPREINSLVVELNILLDQHAANLERARRHVANLAHGLKTPLATLAVALEESACDPENRLQPLVTLMDRRIRHHLARARAAALGGGDRVRTLLAPKIADHVTVFSKLYADNNLVFEISADATTAIACEAQDLDEMLGNLLDNASKWAKERVRIIVATDGFLTDIAVEDDGPGLSDAQTIHVMHPGRRIDENAPGYGFGLPITQELAELYGGTLVLTKSVLGGVKATLALPQSG